MKNRVRITFTEPILGTSPGDPEVFENFVEAKHPEGASKEEREAQKGVEEVADQQSTSFACNDEGTPCLWDYQIKGFFKDAIGMLNRTTGFTKVTAYKKVVDGTLFVYPRKIPLVFDGELGSCQRPLRAQTAKGERIALARSEEAPAGTVIEIEIESLNDKFWTVIEQCLDYGAKRGIGQWRNSGKGRFEWELMDD